MKEACKKVNDRNKRMIEKEKIIDDVIRTGNVKRKGKSIGLEKKLAKAVNWNEVSRRAYEILECNQ